MRFNDAVTGAVIVLFAAAMAAYTVTFPSMPGQAYGPALFPRVIAAGMALCGLILITSGVLRRHRTGAGWTDLDPWLRSPHHLGNFAAVLGALVFYILFARWLGFIITAFLIGAGLTIKLRRGHVASSIAIAAVTTGLVYWAFARMLLVPLPRGLLGPWIW